MKNKNIISGFLLLFFVGGMTTNVFCDDYVSEAKKIAFMQQKFVLEPAKESWAVWLHGHKVDVIANASAGILFFICAASVLKDGIGKLFYYKKISDAEDRFKNLLDSNGYDSTGLRKIEFFRPNNLHPKGMRLVREQYASPASQIKLQEQKDLFLRILDENPDVEIEKRDLFERLDKPFWRSFAPFFKTLFPVVGLSCAAVGIESFSKKYYKEIFKNYISNWEENKEFTHETFHELFEEAYEAHKNGSFEDFWTKKEKESKTFLDDMIKDINDLSKDFVDRFLVAS